jgi:tetratricopeptide (TPR) repeat protein
LARIFYFVKNLFSELTIRVLLATIFLAGSFAVAASAQTAQNNYDTVMILPFENTSGKPEFNWVGESFADALSDLLRVPGLNVVANDERKIIQQKLRVPLTSLPSLATSLKLAREAKASLLIAGKYNIIPAQGDVGASISVTAKIIKVNEGRFLSEEMPDGKRITRDINLSDALGNLQTIHGQLAYQILYQRDKSSLAFSQNQFIELSKKVPPRAFEAYIKGLLTPEADVQTRANFFKNALRLYSDAKSGETYPDAALELGHAFLGQKQFEAAIDYFSRVPANDSHYAEAAFYTGLIHWQKADYERALGVLMPLVDDLKLTSVYNSLGAISVQASRAEKKNKAKAAKFLDDGLALLKRATESDNEDSDSHFNLGLAFFINNNPAEALEQLRPVILQNARDGEAYFLLAKAMEKLNNPKAAEVDSQARIFLTFQNRYAKLEEEYKKTRLVDGIALRVKQPPRRDFVSVVLSKRSANTTAAVEVNETDELLAQARAFYRAGRDDEAMALLRRVLAGEPMSAEAYLILGNIHLRRADTEQAVSSLKTALFWDNRLLDAHIALAKIFLEKKDCLAAQNYAHSAALIDSENSEVIALQRQVERCSK